MPRIECSKINRGRYYVSRVGQALCADITYRGNPPMELTAGYFDDCQLAEIARLEPMTMSLGHRWFGKATEQHAKWLYTGYDLYARQLSKSWIDSAKQKLLERSAEAGL